MLWQTCRRQNNGNERDRSSCYSRSIGQELNIDNNIVLNYLKTAGFKKKLGAIRADAKNLIDRISIYKSLLSRDKVDPFFEVNCDWWWIMAHSVKRQRSWWEVIISAYAFILTKVWIFYTLLIQVISILQLNIQHFNSVILRHKPHK